MHRVVAMADSACPQGGHIIGYQVSLHHDRFSSEHWSLSSWVAVNSEAGSATLCVFTRTTVRMMQQSKV